MTAIITTLKHMHMTPVTIVTPEANTPSTSGSEAEVMMTPAIDSTSETGTEDRMEKMPDATLLP